MIMYTTRHRSVVDFPTTSFLRLGGTRKGLYANPAGVFNILVGQPSVQQTYIQHVADPDI